MLALALPQSVDDLRALLAAVAQARLTFVATLDEARGFERVLVLGDAQDAEVAAALAALRSRGQVAEAVTGDLGALF